MDNLRIRNYKEILIKKTGRWGDVTLKHIFAAHV